jgi:SAM-dependent methyltransferase
VKLTEDMVLQHWELERRLTQELLASSADERWEVFERCYSTLYRELDWLNVVSDEDEQTSAELYGDWPAYIGPPPKDLYEVGSGTGALARFLTERGYRVCASEVTRERGLRERDPPNLSWNHTDGVHLDRFERPGSYDVVISNQVIEHLHPEDLGAHLRSAHALLRPNGRYVFSTPHAYCGPSDVSGVFRRSRPEGMHLREYTYGQLCRGLSTAGFERTSAPLRRRPSAGYLRYLRIAEWLLALIPSRLARRVLLRRVLRPPLFARDLVLIAETGKR